MRRKLTEQPSEKIRCTPVHPRRTRCQCKFVYTITIMNSLLIFPYLNSDHTTGKSTSTIVSETYKRKPLRSLEFRAKQREVNLNLSRRIAGWKTKNQATQKQGNTTADQHNCIKRNAITSTVSSHPPPSKLPKMDTQSVSRSADLYLSSSESKLRACNLESIANKTSNEMMQIVFLVRSALYILLAGVGQDDSFSLFEQSLRMLK